MLEDSTFSLENIQYLHNHFRTVVLQISDNNRDNWIMPAWSHFVMPARYYRKEPLSPLYGFSQSVLLLHPHSYVLYLKLSGRFHAHVELSRSVWLPWSSLKIPAWFLHLEYALFPFLCHKPDSPDESTMSVHHLSLWNCRLWTVFFDWQNSCHIYRRKNLIRCSTIFK